MNVLESLRKAKEDYESLLCEVKDLDEDGQKELYLELQAIVSECVELSLIEGVSRVKGRTRGEELC